MIKAEIKHYVYLHLIIFLYSFVSIASKLAAQQDMFSLPFFMLYGTAIFLLGIYAVAWQQVLKHIPLTVAFCNKALTVIWGLVWGAVFFKEHITVNMIIGAVIVITGVLVVVTSDE